MKNHPTKVGPYTIETEIGSGAMGVVYRARDNRLDRTVALKALQTQVAADSDSLARFDREARALAALNHPNIAAIYGMEQAADQHFLVLEYVAGETLADSLARGPLVLSDALAVLTQIAVSLEAAHEVGIIHRDLKPANIKITHDGTVKLLDFGLARVDQPVDSGNATDETLALAPDHPATTAGTLLGTVPYMSPEQARGETVGKRSDIWALAVIIFECLTGVNPFAKATVSDTIAAILTTEVDLAALPSDTPALISHILRRGLKRDRRARWRNAGDLHLMLEECLEAMPDLPAVTLGSASVVDKKFLVDDNICRSLNADGLDPHIIGWQMQYADNERPSKDLQVWIPSFGEDHSMGAWRDLLASAPCRTIVATPVGFEPDVDHRPHLSLDNQLILLRHLVTKVVDRMRPDKVVVGGFS